MVKPGFEQASSTSLSGDLLTQAQIANLGYGAQQIPFRFDPQQFSLLAPDVTINGKMALSLGIKATAVKATYTVAGQ